MFFLLQVLLVLLLFLLILFLFILFYLMDEPSIRTFLRTFRRDFRGAIIYCRIFFFGMHGLLRNLTIVDYFNENVKRIPKNICFIFEDEKWTYKQVDDLSNKIAHCFLQEGFVKGDEVALFMENCPDYICTWLGLAKIGVITALINTNLKAESLANSMNAINMKGLIFDYNISESLETAMPYIQNVISATFYCYTRKLSRGFVSPFGSKYLNILLDEVSPHPLNQKLFTKSFSDKLLYMYTSGTSGFPKASVFKNKRYVLSAAVGKYGTEMRETQTLFNPLPQYHLTTNVATSFTLVFGGKMVIIKKFSASNFWKDVVNHKVSTCVYIGEICRYLLNQPKVPEETQHSVQLMIGNGLKPHIWKEFQDRFRIKKIIEMYGSTEGNIVLINTEGKVGSIGFCGRTIFRMQGVFPIKVHPETNEFMRDSKGVCIRCKPGETGMLVGKISNFSLMRSFDGYINALDSKKKVIKDCFQKGDKAFTSGDLVMMDEDGYIYFKDRCGDTYRWKGENVSTTEVENVISNILNLTSCVVYGVKIPDCEGRIGMVAIQAENSENIDFEKLYKELREKLPLYAIPAFVRLSSQIEITGTYKHRKIRFQEQGYNPDEIDDPLYVLDKKKKTYVPLTKEIYINIFVGSMQF